jgi:hypothetical protein
VHSAQLWQRTERCVFWGTRTKADLRLEVERRLPSTPIRGSCATIWSYSKGSKTAEEYPPRLRRVTARIEFDGEERLLVFLTNRLDWTPSTVCDLYRSRWQIEVFLKQVNQTVQRVDLLGNNANAVKWRMWTALLVHLLLHFLAGRERRAHPFPRLFAYVRATFWLQRDLVAFLLPRGTAPGHGDTTVPAQTARLCRACYGTARVIPR